MLFEEIAHYIKTISQYEFAERDLEMQIASTKIKQEMNARGLLNSSITIGKLTYFISDEFAVRSEYIRNMLINSIPKLEIKKSSDQITEAKILYQEIIFAEKDKLITFYKNTSSSICASLSGGIHTQFESIMEKTVERSLKKNNTIIEFEYSSFIKRDNSSPVWQIKLGYGECNIDVISLWNRHFKN